MKKFSISVTMLVMTLAFNAYASEIPKADGQNLGGLGDGTGEIVVQRPSRQSVGEDSFNVQLFATRAHLLTNENWVAEATAIVNEILTNRTLAQDVGHRLLTADITQPVARDNKSLWFPTRITGKNGRKLNLNMLRFRQSSSEQANSLANSYSLVGGNFAYSSQALGIIWGASGENGNRSTHTILNSGSGSVMVDEVIFIGVQSTYYPYSSQAQYNSIDGYVQTQNLRLTCVVEVVENGIVLATGARILQATGSPLNPRLSIRKAGSNVVIGFIVEPNRTAILQSSPLESPNPSWTRIATVNSGDEVTQLISGNLIFRAFLQ